MKELQMLFKGEMVRAILEGRKTQTRRVVSCDQKIARLGDVEEWARRLAGNACYGRAITETDIKEKAKQLQGRIHPVITESGTMVGLRCPYGQPGDRLWVREAFRLCVEADATKPRDTDAAYRVWYEADAPHQPGFGRLRPSMHMPRWASRITLEITSVRVERLNDISEADAKAEGADSCIFKGFSTAADLLIDWPLMEEMHPYRNGFALLWESINGPDSWDANPWVWVVEFKRVQS